MIAELLAADPTTPPDVLAHLAARTLTPAANRALAANPNLPATAPLHLPPPNATELRTALANAAVPAARRLEFIDATPRDDVTWNIRHHNDLTPDELTHIFTTHPNTLPSGASRLTALALNPRTPTPVAAAIVTLLRQSSTHAVLSESTALRHHLPCAGVARDAERSVDPLTTYAHQILHRARTSDAPWWAGTIDDFPHPAITAAALDIAGAAPNTYLAAVICRAIASSPRATTEHRERATTLSPPTIAQFADAASDTFLRAYVTRTGTPYGWDNPNVTDPTLRAMLTHALPGPNGLYVRTAIALHPASSPALRRAALAAPTGALPWLTTLVTNLNTAAPDAALDSSCDDLLDAAAVTAHAHHWTRAAWAHHHRDQPATIDYAQALLTLEGAPFPGTLRNMIATARAIAA